MSPQQLREKYNPIHAASDRIYIAAGANLIIGVLSFFGIFEEQNYFASTLLIVLAGVYFFIGYRLRKNPSLSLIFIFPILVVLQFIGFAYLENQFRNIDILLIGLMGLLAIASVYETYKPIRNIQKI